MPEIEQIIRNIQAGSLEDCDILQAYVSKKQGGIVNSLGIIPASNLAHQMTHKIGTYDRTHPIEGVLFRCLLFKNVSGICFKYQSGD